MNKARITFGLTPWSSDGKPPTRFRLFKYGDNRSTKGTVYLTAESAQKCFASWRDYGNDLSGDYNHSITNPHIESPRASMWFSLALESDGLYAVNVKYTPSAYKAIEEKEYRYYSPYFSIETDNKNRQCVVEIINVALTNTPATKNQRPLVALSKLVWSKMFKQEQIDALKALLVEGGVDEAMSSDLILKMQSVLCTEEAPEMEEVMPMADPMPEEMKPEELSLGKDEEKMNEAFKKAFSAMEAQVKALNAKIANIETEKKKEATNAKEALFVQYKREGRLAHVNDAEAREILNLNPNLFKRTFGAVTPLTQKAPTAPPLKGVTEVAAPQGLIAPVIEDSAVKAHMALTKTDYRTAYSALSRLAKGAN